MSTKYTLPINAQCRPRCRVSCSARITWKTLRTRHEREPVPWQPSLILNDRLGLFRPATQFVPQRVSSVISNSVAPTLFRVFAGPPIKPFTHDRVPTLSSCLEWDPANPSPPDRAALAYMTKKVILTTPRKQRAEYEVPGTLTRCALYNDQCPWHIPPGTTRRRLQLPCTCAFVHWRQWPCVASIGLIFAHNPRRWILIRPEPHCELLHYGFCPGAHGSLIRTLTGHNFSADVVFSLTFTLAIRHCSRVPKQDITFFQRT